MLHSEQHLVPKKCAFGKKCRETVVSTNLQHSSEQTEKQIYVIKIF